MVETPPRVPVSPPPFRARAQGDLGPVYAEQVQRWIENLILALLYCWFAWTHLQLAQATGRWRTAAPILVQESLVAMLFLVRRPSTITSSQTCDWVVGVVGTFLPLTLRPGGASFAFGANLQLVGFVISISGLASLGRSIGIVAANRGVQTRGAYRVVRHPMYAGHILCLAGYLAAYPSARNLVIVAGTLVALVARMHAEEGVLDQDPHYRAYRARVPWRLVPGGW